MMSHAQCVNTNSCTFIYKYSKTKATSCGQTWLNSREEFGLTEAVQIGITVKLNYQNIIFIISCLIKLTGSLRKEFFGGLKPPLLPKLGNKD